jgi:hypothetical protein
VAKNYNIIELNGNRYDAVTGARLNSHAAATKQHLPAARSVKPKAPSMQRGHAVDGFLSPKQHGAHGGVNLASIPVKPVPKPASKHTVHPLKPLEPHKPEHSKTLMRHALHAPKIVPNKPLKVQAPTDLVKHQPAVLTVKPKLSSEQVDDTRAERAKQVPKSSVVDRFHRPTRLRSASGAALSAPIVHPSKPTASSMDSVASAQRQRVATATTRSSALFEQALSTATSHTQKAPKETTRHKSHRFTKRHVKFLSMATTTLTVIVLGGFIAYQNKAGLELQLASTKAGFHATMPAYKPKGYAYTKLDYSPGSVTIGFRSNVKAFSVSQKESNWDNTTLLDNYVATSGNTYQAYAAAGRTIYIYSNGTATWVNGGVWYQINGNADLNDNQIISLATSM